MKVKVIRGVCILTLYAVLLSILTGCPSPISMWTRGPKGNPIKPEEVKIVSTFKDIGFSYRVEGLVCGAVFPAFKNNSETREALLKEIAAEKGINTLIGLQPKIGELYAGTSMAGATVGILANSGISSIGTSAPPPKFIICLPPVKFKINLDLSTDKADAMLRDTIQLLFARRKGYYVYKTDLPIADPPNISIDSFNSLGIPADYVLNCEVEQYDKMDDNDDTYLIRTVKLMMSLFDLKEQKTVWTQASERNFPFKLEKSIGDYALEGAIEGVMAGLFSVATRSNTFVIPANTTNKQDYLSINAYHFVEDVIDSVPPATADFK